MDHSYRGHDKHTDKQASKKTDFTVDLTWWRTLRLAPIIGCHNTDHRYYTIWFLPVTRKRSIRAVYKTLRNDSKATFATVRLLDHTKNP